MFTPIIVKFDTYPASRVVDIIFRVAGVQSQRRAEGEAYAAIAAAGFSVEAMLAFLATDPVQS